MYFPTYLLTYVNYIFFQVAENIKEFFHKEGIHSTTIQPEFVDYHPASDSSGTTDEDCVLNCPKGPGSIPAPACEASKCCVPTSAANSNGNLKRQTSKSAQNTPTTSRRPTSFHEGHEVISDISNGVQGTRHLAWIGSWSQHANMNLYKST